MVPPIGIYPGHIPNMGEIGYPLFGMIYNDAQMVGRWYVLVFVVYHTGIYHNDFVEYPQLYIYPWCANFSKPDTSTFRESVRRHGVWTTKKYL